MQAVSLAIVFLVTTFEISCEYLEDRNENIVLVRPEVHSFFLSKDTESFFGDNDTQLRPRRSATQNEACELPLSPGNSEVCCRSSPNHMTCVQTCVWGHTLREGRQKTVNCHEGIWDFIGPTILLEKCKPYVDCTLQLGPGSHVECWSNFMDHGPICEVACKQLDDMEPVEKLLYKCDIEGQWSPPLPFCVIPGKGIGLVVPPGAQHIEEKVHPDELLKKHH